MKVRVTLTIIFFVGIVLTACAAPASPAGNPLVNATPIPTAKPAASPTPPPASDVVPPVIQAVKAFAASRYGATAGDVNIVKMEPVDWPNTCLGAEQPGEMCAQMIVPGYQIQVSIQGKTYTLNTDTGGQSIRVATSPASTAQPNPVAETARRWLANTLKLDASAIQMISITPQQWPDGCLGIHKPDIACTDMIVPGYRVILQAQGTNYEVRTDETAKAIGLADQPTVSTTPKSTGLSNPVFGWKSGSNPCTALQIAGSQAAFGPCGSTPKVVSLVNPQRGQDLAYFVKTFASITAQTPAGEIILTGSGSTQPTANQQRALAEWAQMVYLEVSSPTPMPNNGLALTWHREGGIAGFCDDLKIYRSGFAQASSCKGSQQQPASTGWLSDAQLTPLFTWLDQLQTSDGKTTDPATADAMTVTWMLSSSGKRAPTEVERQQITGLAAQVYASLK